MRTVLLVCLLAIAAVAVLGQNTVSPSPAVEEYTPAIMSSPPASLKKPIIFAPTVQAGAPDADAPLVGKPPSNLKKSVVTEHIYGGAVEFIQGKSPQGCNCRKQLPEKFRYDAKFKPERQLNATNPCGCAQPVPKPEDKLPPVLAAFYPERRNHTLKANATACLKAVVPPVAEKIAPSYYPKRFKGLKANVTAPCAKPVQAAAPVTITPSFYPARPENKNKRSNRKGRKGNKKRAAKKQAKKQAKKAARKAAKAKKQAKKAAKRKAVKKF